jgi:dienelactone hydrolase
MRVSKAGLAVLACIVSAAAQLVVAGGEPSAADEHGWRRTHDRVRPIPPIRCDPSIGVVAPLETCSEVWPCTDLLLTYGTLEPPITMIDTPTDTPFCATGERGLERGRPEYHDGPPAVWRDGDGVNRYRCQVIPDAAKRESGWPLVIWLPGSGGYAGSVYDTTSLRGRTETFELAGRGEGPGFILVSIQPRNLHWPNPSPQDGTKHDSYHRDIESPSRNPDIAHLDAVIDTMVGGGLVDRERIYLMGWSNGGRFAALYGIARHDNQTPGGNRVAAAVMFSSGDPFENNSHGREPSCRQDPYPKSRLPILYISRSCDVVACNAEQDARLRETVAVNPGNVAETWVEILRETIGNPNVEWILLTRRGRQVEQCNPAWLCGPVAATLNHVRWPDGIDDGGGRDWEPTMLEFLRDHPLRPETR